MILAEAHALRSVDQIEVPSAGDGVVLVAEELSAYDDHGHRALDTVSLTLKRKNLARQLDDLAGEGFGSYAVFRPGQSPEVKTLVRRTESAGGADA